jgi:hypothetical protein
LRTCVWCTALVTKVFGCSALMTTGVCEVLA